MRLSPELTQQVLALVGEHPGAPKPRKYRNVPTVVDGIRYDSAKEARHAALLLAMERDGLIFELRRQVRFPLKVSGVLVCTYVADFEFRTADRERVVQDVKGVPTPVYKIKKKLMLAIHGIDIQEV